MSAQKQLRADINQFRQRARIYLASLSKYAAAIRAPSSARTSHAIWSEYRRLEAWRSSLNWQGADQVWSGSRGGRHRATYTSLLGAVLISICIAAPIVAFFVLGAPGNESVNFTYNIDLVDAAVGSALTIIAAFAAAAYIGSTQPSSDTPTSGGIPPLPAPPWPEPQAPEGSEDEAASEAEASTRPPDGSFSLEEE